MYDISIAISFSRPKDLPALFTSLAGNKCRYEVVLVGDKDIDFALPNFCKVYKSGVKPAQCWEAAVRLSLGKYVSWSADDAEYSPGALDKMVEMLESETPPTIGAFRTIEDGQELTKRHIYNQQDENSKLMAPLGACSKELYMQLGGIDKRFITGQWENDLSMKVYEIGGQVKVCEDAYCYLDHVKKHEGGSSTMSAGYMRGRQVLNEIWGAPPTYIRISPPQRFDDSDLLGKSQGENKSWERVWA